MDNPANIAILSAEDGGYVIADADNRSKIVGVSKSKTELKFALSNFFEFNEYSDVHINTIESFVKLILLGEKIDAIKYLRRMNGCDLMDAKRSVEYILSVRSLYMQTNAP